MQADFDHMYMTWLIDQYAKSGKKKWLDLLEIHIKFLKKLNAHEVESVQQSRIAKTQ